MFYVLILNEPMFIIIQVLEYVKLKYSDHFFMAGIHQVQCTKQNEYNRWNLV